MAEIRGFEYGEMDRRRSVEELEYARLQAMYKEIGRIPETEEVEEEPVAEEPEVEEPEAEEETVEEPEAEEPAEEPEAETPEAEEPEVEEPAEPKAKSKKK